MKASAHEDRGTVFNIQHFSVHDGPGIRTVVFLKGCPLRCAWCANPESQRASLELAWAKESCIGCQLCVRDLPELSCRFTDGDLTWDTGAEFDPEEAERVCPAEAFRVIGQEMSAFEVLAEARKDAPFFDTSGGGLTLSGGEPLMQPEFTRAILRAAGEEKLHRAIETTGFAAEEVFLSVVAEVDFLIYDLKLFDEEKHRKFTGVSNSIILRNLEKARETFPALPILVRTPVVPEVNDNEEELGAIADFLRGKRINHELLKYHRLGIAKYRRLNRNYALPEEIELSAERFKALSDFAEERLQRGYWTPSI